MTGFSFDLILKSPRNVGDLTPWLERNCVGRWGLQAVRTGTDLRHRCFRVMFADEADRARFETAFSGEVATAVE